VLRTVAEAARSWPEERKRCSSRVVCGKGIQAENEARLARDLGYDAALLSLSAFAGAGRGELVAHCRSIATILPVFGFYLQPAVGGRVLEYAFWREFAQIDGVVGIKIAPFNRYQTLDGSGRSAMPGGLSDVALYTGNDDTILMDLLTEFRLAGSGGEVRARIAGGLLGHWRSGRNAPWSCWIG
jgi:dihydrodipicolinate synthase/N-acetylneuraminate lyase